MDKFSGVERSKNHRKPRGKKSQDYVDNDRLYLELIEYKKQLTEAEKNGTIHPQASNFIGISIEKICRNLSSNHNFIGYTFREEMIDDAIESCVKAIRSFDPAKSTKPFSYLSECAWWAFVQRIKREAKENYTKHKNLDRIAGAEIPALFIDPEIHYKVIHDFEEKEAQNKERKAQKKREKENAN